MSRAKDLVDLDKRHVWHPFTQARIAPDPIPIRSARGAVLYAEDGKEYLDLVSSWWVTLHGHAHPKITAAIAEQAARLEQVMFAEFTHEPAVELVRRLAGLLPGDLDRGFFSDDGSTAVEVALKLAHQYWQNKGEPGRKRYLALEGGYHGDTFGAMSAASNSGFFAPWRDLLFDVTALPFPETWDADNSAGEREQAALAALDEELSAHGTETAALIIEPLVQGAAGMRMCRPEFLKALGMRLGRSGVLLIFDEVMTGFGRTGELFACLKAGVTPDIICLSKGLTGGFLPLSLTVCRNPIFDAFLGPSFDEAFTHGHSFTGNPLGCAAALASLDLLLEDETRERMAGIEALHRERMAAIPDHARIEKRRVSGTIAALDIRCDDPGYKAAVGPKLKAYFMERGLLIRPLGNVIYLIPPLCITDDELHRAYDAIEAAVEEVIG